VFRGFVWLVIKEGGGGGERKGEGWWERTTTKRRWGGGGGGGHDLLHATTHIRCQNVPRERPPV